MTFVSILYVILAILGLSFLVFIHELGHYLMARRLGMRVETFSIGFGKPLYSWERNGVRWQIGWLLFGGYVKIAGMDPAEQRDLYEVKDGFFGKSPLDRIKVAFMGPFVNIVFALLIFVFLWSIGGRDKNFSDYTHKIGWVDPKSDLYMKGVRPGDEIVAYDQQAYQSAKDNIYVPMTAPGEIQVQGDHVNFKTKEKTPFSYSVNTYPHPYALENDILTAGILQPANYIIYEKLPNGKDNPLPEGSPMQGSGIQYGDRIVWVDGVPIYSNQELAHVLNDAKALLMIQHGNQTELRRVPRVLAEELKLDAEFREELIDWQFEAQLNGMKIQKLHVIPYHLNNEGVVESRAKFIDKEKEEEAFPHHMFSSIDKPLEEGDKILAVDGIPVAHSYQVLSHLQQHHVNIIVERDPAKLVQIPSWQKADALFDQQYDWENLKQIVSHIGLSTPLRSSGNLVLLHPIVPKMRKDFQLSPESQARLQDEINEQKREVEGIEDPEKRAQVRRQLENRDHQLLLGLPSIQDEHVQYNPNPISLFDRVFEEIWHTLKALVTGSLNPKWMSGPVGIVQVVHDTSMSSPKEALFWLGAISLNLGILNLLPLPVLDGGTICFALYEMVTGRKLKTQTLEKLIIPFALLLIGFFIFLTYHDLTRIFSRWPH